jgi:AcrR family transcriptional regulator
MRKSTATETLERRNEILNAALHCFLTLGYSHTSMQDVASRANLSRTLLYHQFKNKSDLLNAIFQHLTEEPMNQAKALVRKNPTSATSMAKTLNEMIHLIVVEPWSKIAGFPKSNEFFDACGLHNESQYAKFESQQLKLFESFFDHKIEAEVFTLALNALLEDFPSLPTLNKRIALLIQKFTHHD